MQVIRSIAFVRLQRIYVPLKMAFNLNWFVHLLEVCHFFRCQLLSARRQRLVNPFDAAKTNNGAGHALSRPCQGDLWHGPSFALREFFDPVDDLRCFRPETRRVLAAASRACRSSTCCQGTGKLSFCKGSPLIEMAMISKCRAWYREIVSTHWNNSYARGIAELDHLAFFFAIKQVVPILSQGSAEFKQPKKPTTQLTCIAINFVHPFFSAQNCIMANWYVHIDEAPI